MLPNSVYPSTKSFSRLQAYSCRDRKQASRLLLQQLASSPQSLFSLFPPVPSSIVTLQLNVNETMKNTTLLDLVTTTAANSTIRVVIRCITTAVGGATRAVIVPYPSLGFMRDITESFSRHLFRNRGYARSVGGVGRSSTIIASIISVLCVASRTLGTLSSGESV